MARVTADEALLSCPDARDAFLLGNGYEHPQILQMLFQFQQR